MGSFEVFSSGGGWDFLFGKPLLEAFKAVHDYKTDLVRIPAESGVAVDIPNKHKSEMRISNIDGGVANSLKTPPVRRVQIIDVDEMEEADINEDVICNKTLAEMPFFSAKSTIEAGAARKIKSPRLLQHRREREEAEDRL